MVATEPAATVTPRAALSRSAATAKPRRPPLRQRRPSPKHPPKPPPSSNATPSRRRPDDCSTPVWFDGAGVKHYKPQCLDKSSSIEPANRLRSLACRRGCVRRHAALDGGGRGRGCHVGAARSARADEKQACVAASGKAQQLRSAGKLGEARDQLVICGRPECPKLVQQDCTQWMSEVLGSLPSVVPGAKDKQGPRHHRCRPDRRRKGRHRECSTDKAFPVDPGVHSFVFETKGAARGEEQVVVKPGEKNRILTVTFATPDEPKDKKKDPKGRTDGEKPTPPIAAYITGGIGVIALGAALYIDLDANAEARKLRDDVRAEVRTEPSRQRREPLRHRWRDRGPRRRRAHRRHRALLHSLEREQRHEKSGKGFLLPSVAPLARGGVATTGFRF